MNPKQVKMNPKAEAFIRRYIDTFNPVEPSEKLVELLDEYVLPKGNYVTKSQRGVKLISLPIDSVEYFAYRCEQCPADLRLKAKLVYFIKWYEEVITDGDAVDLEDYFIGFRKEFQGYKIDFDAIDTTTDVTVVDTVELTAPAVLLDIPVVEITAPIETVVHVVAIIAKSCSVCNGGKLSPFTKNGLCELHKVEQNNKFNIKT